MGIEKKCKVFSFDSEKNFCIINSYFLFFSMADYSHLQMKILFLSLPKDDQECLIQKAHKDAIKMHIDRILSINTPLVVRFHTWINRNAAQKAWYLKNINQITLHPDGIEIFWEYISSQDRENIQDKSSIWNVSDISGELPDWKKIVAKFPQKLRESFFLEVLQMSGKYLWASCDTIATSKDKIVLQSALYQRWKLRSRG